MVQARRKAAKEALAPIDEAPAFLPVEVAAISSNASPPNCERAEIAFPNGRHLFVSPGLDRRLLEDLIGAVAAASGQFASICYGMGRVRCVQLLSLK